MNQTSSEGQRDSTAGPATDDTSRTAGSPEAGAPQGRAGFDSTALRDLGALRRSTVDRKVAGVAGGLGRHFGIDPTLLRVLFVVAAFFGGAGLVAYVAFWLLVPREDTGAAVIDTAIGTRQVLLIAVGICAALLIVGDSWSGSPGLPFVLVPLGIAAILYVVLKERGEGGDRPVPATSAAGTTPGTAPGAATGAPPSAYGPPAYGATPPTSTGSYGPPQPPPAGPAYYYPEPPPPPAPPVRPDRGPRLFWPTLALVAIAWGILGIADTYGGGVVDGAYPATALAVVGAMLVLGSRVGRPGGLVPLGVVLALVLAGTTFGDSFDDAPDNDRRVVTPMSAAVIDDRYRMNTGAFELDLREVTDLEALDGRTIRVDGDAGELRVLLPEGLDATVDASIGAVGAIDLPGRSTGGFSVDATERIDEDPGSDDPTVDLQLDLVAGHIEVRQ